MSAPLDLCEWLGTATRGLPAHLKARIYDELNAHYQDAYDDAAAGGSSADEAHRLALSHLGDPRLTARALRATHLSRRRYTWAMSAALASLLWVVVGTLMMGSTVLYSLFAFALFVFVNRAFRSMLEADGEAVMSPTTARSPSSFRMPDAFNVIEVCALLVIVAGMLGTIDRLHYPGAIMLTDPVIIDANLYPQEITAIHVLMTVAMCGVGVGWLMVNERLIDESARLHRLAPLLRVFIMINGLALIASGVALLMRHDNALALATLIAAPAGFARQALFTLLFYRAAFGVGRQSRPRGLA